MHAFGPFSHNTAADFAIVCVPGIVLHSTVQVTGITPIVNIDKTDGCQVYLSEQCKNAPIITAKSSEMNVMVPKGDGDYVSPRQAGTS